MKKLNKRGFTLIELLAVIVILGLLMAIAIPSVTKYITQSRKKTLTNTIGNYISALTNEVNDMQYTFTDTKKIFAVPIDCIAVERGGTDPFGVWHSKKADGTNTGFYAYVLVQYNDETSSYTYGFTFKDSAGYGLLPTTTTKLKESGSQIQTGLGVDIKKGYTREGSTLGNMFKDSGFNVSILNAGNNDVWKLTLIWPLEAAQTGDGKTTCTIAQTQ